MQKRQKVELINMLLWATSFAGAFVITLLFAILAGYVAIQTLPGALGGVLLLSCFVFVGMVHPIYSGLRERVFGNIDASKCVYCDYDIRGLRTPICPECGHPFSDSPTIPNHTSLETDDE
jgi:hypothetical protein